MGDYMKKYSENITLFSPHSKLVDLLCNSLKDGAKVAIKSPLNMSKSVTVIFRNGEFYRQRKKEIWTKEQFLNYASGCSHASVMVNRKDVIDDYQKYSDNEIARKVGDYSLARTMSELDEEGKDVWR